jgi:hypothetical protein
VLKKVAAADAGRGEGYDRFNIRGKVEGGADGESGTEEMSGKYDGHGPRRAQPLGDKWAQNPPGSIEPAVAGRSTGAADIGIKQVFRAARGAAEGDEGAALSLETDGPDMPGFKDTRVLCGGEVAADLFGVRPIGEESDRSQDGAESLEAPERLGLGERIGHGDDGRFRGSAFSAPGLERLLDAAVLISPVFGEPEGRISISER